MNNQQQAVAMIVLLAPTTETTEQPKNTNDITDVSFGGVNYAVENGKVTVPLAAAEHLYQFGFINAPIDEQIDNSKPKKQTKKPPENQDSPPTEVEVEGLD